MAWIIPAAMTAVGAILKKKGQDKHDKAAYEAKKAEFDAAEKKRAARAQLVRSILKGYGIEGAVDPAFLDSLSTPRQFPAFDSSTNWLDMAGGALSGASPFAYAGLTAKKPAAAASTNRGATLPVGGGISLDGVSSPAPLDFSNLFGDDEISPVSSVSFEDLMRRNQG